MNFSTTFLSSCLLSCCFALAFGCSGKSGLPSKEGSLQEMYYTPDKCEFSVWAPTADSVKLSIYEDGLTGSPYFVTSMSRIKDGSWTASVNGDLDGKFYTFNVKVQGKWLGETPGIFAVASGANGRRAAIVDMEKTNPSGWDKDSSPAPESYADIIIYEVHHRDFSISGNSGMKNKGKYLAMTEKGTENGYGKSTGIDHLKELGITHVHLLPSYDFGSIDETRLEENRYNWGYDPVNYNLPEGSYSTDPYNPYTRIREFKEMVKALHDAGISVIMDVVYNHVFNAAAHSFEKTVPGYFFRMNPDGTFADGSACGNETASDREMMRRYMVESVCRWATEYHIDGFRFDLMGIHDIETMNAIRKALDEIDPRIFIYGEGWAAKAPKYPSEMLAMKANTYKMPRIAAFSDEMRDGIRGPFNDNTKAGFAAGIAGNEENVKFGIVGAIEHPGVDYTKVDYSKQAWADQPTQMISYVTCHDDMCLTDRFRATVPGISETEIIKLDKLSQTIVLTSQGVPFILSGEELFRDKKGVHNSFESPDSVNRFDWFNKTKYYDLFEYYRDLIALRKAHPAFRLGDADLVRKHLEFIPTEAGIIAYRLKGHAGGDPCEEITVIFNSHKDSRKVLLENAGTATYRILCADGKIDLEGNKTISGPEIKVGPGQAMIICR